MMRRGLLLLSLSSCLLSSLSWGGQGADSLLERLKFTSVELLIYTDQLQLFEGTRCTANVVSHYDVGATRQQLLARLDVNHRAEFEQLLESEQVSLLLSENKSGVEAMLGPQQLLGGDGQLDQQQRAACLELGGVFQANYLQTQQDLEMLFKQYLQ
ncbi:MAG: hypothetical protein V7752_15330 [Halopseudomonas sp.]